MEIRDALPIVRKLADGVHPETGEVLQTDCLYNHPQTVRALHRAVEALEFQDERERTKRFLPSNAGKAWSNQEDAQICEELRRGLTFEQIAQIHNRTNGPSSRDWCGWERFPQGRKPRRPHETRTQHADPSNASRRTCDG